MKLIGELYARKLILTWLRDKKSGWELTSGDWSPFYFMFREVPFFPDLFNYSVDSLVNLVESLRKETPIDAVVGVASTGIPLAAGVALKLDIPLAFTRKVAGIRTLEDLDRVSGEWGSHSLVEGRFEDGMKYLLVDDVVTGGASKQLARAQVELEAKRRKINLNFVGTAVVVDRGYPSFDSSDLGILSAHRLFDELDQIEEFGGTKTETEVIRDYLTDSKKYQNEEVKRSVVDRNVKRG